MTAPGRLPAVLDAPRLRLFVRLVSNGLIQALALVAMLFLVRAIFDAMTARPPGGRLREVLLMGLALAAVAAVRGFLAYWSRVDAARLGRGYAHALRLHMYDHLTSLPPRSLQRRSGGAVMLRFTGDLSAVRRWVSRGLAGGTVSILTIAMGLAILSWLSWPLAAAVIAFLLLDLAAGLPAVRRLRQSVALLRRVRAHLMAAIGEQISASGAVQVFGQEARERRRFARRSRHVVDAAITQARAAGLLRAVTSTASTATRAAILVVGAFEVAAGRTTVGTVAAAMTVAGVLASRTRRLRRIYFYSQKAEVARHEIRRFLAIPPLADVGRDAPDLRPGPGRLDFEGVTLGDAVKNVTATAEPGTLVVLAGPNGAGKSTLLALASRLVDPDEGHIRLDGQDLAAHSLLSVRRAISMAGPDLPLLRGSIARNIRYRAPRADDNEIARVRELCNLDRMLAALPDGAQTRVREGGRNLSLGQRQLVGLARAVLGDPAVLLLDEVDANLDAEASRALDAVLERFRGTVLMVSHQPDRLARADAVWHMEGGRLVRVERSRRG